MQTAHELRVGDARTFELPPESVDLVVTSPPYPMVEMWDDLFTDLNPAVGRHLDGGDGQAAFDAMHEQLDAVWAEVERVLVDGGIACVNVGDATRTVGEGFRVYQNHSLRSSQKNAEAYRSSSFAGNSRVPSFRNRRTCSCSSVA